jgi:hypothetical protein
LIEPASKVVVAGELNEIEVEAVVIFVRTPVAGL